MSRVIQEQYCGDGVLSRGEICLGLGNRSELNIEGLEGQVLRVADFDGDTHLDVLVMGLDPAEVVVTRLWRGRGDGSFEEPIDPGLSGCRAYAVPGDADGDEVRDVLVDECGPSISVVLGRTTGVFEPPVSVPMGLETRSAGLVDLDDDGQREIVMLGADPDGRYGIALAERDAQGVFGAPSSSILGNAADGFDPTGMGLLDLDDDAVIDAVLVDSGQVGSLRLARGEPGLGFAPPVAIGPPGLVANTMITRDLDEDGLVDVLAFNFDEESLIFLRSVDGDLVETRRTIVPALRTGPAGGGDIDADGHLDLLLFEPGTSELQAWFGVGDGTFDGPLPVQLGVDIGQIALADIDEDGALDIVAGTFEAGTVQVLLSDP
ncbi:MAG: VCBS repeat-containing protein [Deltaproteobacteria bacterium]|nr:VCBS repeat-containing protein [Deltaproteobacteria bacterium]